MRDRLLKFWRDWRGLLVFFAVMILFRSAVADWNQVPSGSMKPGILAGDRIVVDKLAWDLRVPFTTVRVAGWSHPSRGDVVTFDNPVDGRLFIKRVVAVPGDRVEWNRNRLTINGEVASYTALGAEEARRFPVDDRGNHRFYRESLLGVSRVVMLDGRPGAPDPHGNVLSRLLAPASRNCERYAGREASAGAALGRAICRCADLGACSTFPAFTVPEGKYWMMGDNRDNSSDSRVIGFVDRQSIFGRAHAVAFSVDPDNYYWPRFERFFTNLDWQARIRDAFNLDS